VSRPACAAAGTEAALQYKQLVRAFLRDRSD
jgi:hypothetical protein